MGKDTLLILLTIGNAWSVLYIMWVERRIKKLGAEITYRMLLLAKYHGRMIGVNVIDEGFCNEPKPDPNIKNIIKFRKDREDDTDK